jgi:hypothetical protein
MSYDEIMRRENRKKEKRLKKQREYQDAYRWRRNALAVLDRAYKAQSKAMEEKYKLSHLDATFLDRDRACCEALKPILKSYQKEREALREDLECFEEEAQYLAMVAALEDYDFETEKAVDRRRDSGWAAVRAEPDLNKRELMSYELREGYHEYTHKRAVEREKLKRRWLRKPQATYVEALEDEAD